MRLRKAFKRTFIAALTLIAGAVPARAGEASAPAAKAPETVWAEAWFAVAADIDRRGEDIRRLAGMMLQKNPAWSLPVLRENLRSTNSIDQQTAAELLGKIGTPAAEEPLLELYARGDLFARSHALQALTDLYGRFPAPLLCQRLMGRVPAGEKSRPENAGNPAEKAVPPAEKITLAALYALYKNGKNGEKLNTETENAVLALARDKRAEVRDAAWTVLRFGVSPAVTAAALEALNDKSLPEKTVAAVCGVLQALPPANNAPQLELWARNASPAVALEADGALLALGSDAARERLRKTAADARSPLRCRALRLLGARPDAGYFLNLLNDPAPAVRLEAARALQNLDKVKRADAGRFFPLVYIITGDDSPEVRAVAARARARIDRPRAVAALRDAALNTDGGKKAAARRMAALWALGEIKAGEALRLLRDLCRDPHPGVAGAAVEALGKIDTTSSSEALYDVLGDSRETVAVPARAALFARFNADPGNTLAEREAWKKKYLRN